MTLEQTPWMIDGGAVHSAAIARQVAYVATSGRQGVLSPTDLRVRANGVANSNVLVGGGSAVVLGSYANQTGQSYTSRNQGDEAVSIPATSAGARADLIILSIDDPEYSGSVPPDPTNYPYAKFERVSNVAAGATVAPSSVTKPHIVLARINVPPNTAAITDAMITDLRKIANPRSQRFLQSIGGSGTETLTATVVNGQAFPSNAVWNVEVPSWATHVRIKTDWNGIMGPAAAGAQFAAQFWPRLGSSDIFGARVIIDRPTTNDHVRESASGGTTFAIPAAMRGTVQPLSMRGYILNVSSSAARPQATASTYVVADLEFVEEL